MSSIFIVVCEDRHADPKITVHRTRAGADARVDAFMASYGGVYAWTEEPVDGWERNAITDSDDGPTARIEPGEIEP